MKVQIETIEGDSVQQYRLINPDFISTRQTFGMIAVTKQKAAVTGQPEKET